MAPELIIPSEALRKGGPPASSFVHGVILDTDVITLTAQCLVCLALLLPLTAAAQALGDDRTPQTTNSTPGIPTFYAHGRQVIVAATVWNPPDKNSRTSWVTEEIPKRVDRAALEGILQQLPPPARGLTAGDFQVFENSLEQRINYFKESDFAAADLSGRWNLLPHTAGSWGMSYENKLGFAFPLATYFIGYVPPALHAGECRAIRVAVKGRYVELNRDRYCAAENSGTPGPTTLQGANFGDRPEGFASFASTGSIQLFMRPSTFWSSGVLWLVGETSATTKATSPPDGGFTYLVEVHDSKAPATVLIAIGFDSQKKTWRFPCRSDDHPIQVIGMIYKDDGGIAAQFSDTFSCTMPPSFFWERMKRAAPYGSDDRYLKPSRFYTQVELVPGEYELSLVVHEGKKFGRGRQSFRVEPLDPGQLTLSDIVPIAALRDASWVLRDAAAVSPSPVVPTPLVSKNVQFIPRADAPLHLEKHTPLYVYVEVYEPRLKQQVRPFTTKCESPT